MSGANTKRTRPSTDELIRALAQAPLPPAFNAGAMIATMGALILVSLSGFWAVFGFRADLAIAIAAPGVMMKSALPLALGAIAMALAVTASRPMARLVLWPLALPALAGFALVALRLPDVPAGGMQMEVVGKTATICLMTIIGLSVLPTGLGIRYLRRGAPLRPVLAGALLGLASGAGIAAGYALHCMEDSPLYFVTWYGTGIATAGGIGAALGHRFLRW